ncbi:type II secretion system F family protein [Frankia sp. AgB1.9]|uniref:type II secretion system F family protein n=1 Tax=unclassified Frankia TaxID=2632575 RepID=UPI001932B221|nr:MULTISPECIES: type II secretion system F family protein [unclassified Frankia]MBL7489716.1 type II secretion system F family protein [Frankia sp. AgW1.1]MBL7551926.1 type II secretion system F family protein [Frankia sp. AgB1.9]MBL7623235.1 type II secretion system F family protein [Frankia sp. AgB1.8]
MTGTAVLCGIATGLGLWLAYTGLRPRRPDLATLLAQLQPTAPPPPASGLDAAEAGRVGWATRVGLPLAVRLDASRLLTGASRADLAALNRDPTAHLAEKITAAVVGFFLPPVLAAALALAGSPLPLALPGVLAVALAAGGFFAPDRTVHTDAEAARRALRAAFAAFLDLATIALAGGAGLEQALDDAANAGTGPAYAKLRHAVEQAVLTGRPIWEPLITLGERHGVSELVETAAAVALAGTEGARIRATLTQKATTLRLRQLTTAEADATAATERMSLPVVLLFLGFLILIGYPAVAAITSL